MRQAGHAAVPTDPPGTERVPLPGPAPGPAPVAAAPRSDSGSRWQPPWRIWLLTASALVAFAANSVLCRLALAPAAIDPLSFSTLRVVSGALTLAMVVGVRGRRPAASPGPSWGSAGALLAYMLGFSFAYVSLTAGTGALILFGAVQATMLLAGLLAGERLAPAQWAGLLLALGGLVLLQLPGVSAPAPVGAALMAVAGVAWGLYSLRGRGNPAPLSATAASFAGAAVPLLALTPLLLPLLWWSAPGALWAVLSGSVTSGLGYVAWYAAVRGLTATRAAIVQLPVPVLTAIAGVIFLSETVSARLVLCGLAVLGGVALAVVGPGRAGRRQHSRRGA